MMTEKKRKILYWVFKCLSVVISCLLPIWAICEKFPLWTVKHGESQSIGVGAIFIIAVVLIVFRKAVFKFLSDRLNLQHAPPVMIWLVLLLISYILVFVANFLRDLNTIFWMGLIGCSIGTGLTFIAEHCFAKNKEEGNSDGQN